MHSRSGFCLASVARRMAPIPVALCGKNPSMASSFVHTMSDQDYEVVHVWHDTATAKRELSSLLHGQPTKPSSGLGSNTHSDSPKAPKAVIVGAGFSRSELEDMLAAPMLNSVPWLYPSAMGMVSTTAQSLTGKGFMQSIVDRARSVLQKNGLVVGAESVKPGVWTF